MDGTWKYHPEWGNPVTKEHTWYALTDKCTLAQKFRIPKIEFTDNMKPKEKEDESVEASVLRRGNKILTGGNIETKCGAETEGKAIERLPHLGIYSIYSHQTKTLLWMPGCACWWKPDMAVSWEALTEPDKYRGGNSQPTFGLSSGVPDGRDGEETEGTEGVCSSMKGAKVWTGQTTPRAPEDWTTNQRIHME